MAVVQNQLDTIFQNQLGRSPTDYEIKKYSTASPQTLANLKDTYSKLNPDKSISDYLTHTGQDSSLEARQALGLKYGIPNVGTAEGNIALLKAMKTPVQPTTNTVQGSIIPPTPNPTPTPTSTGIQGSIQGATTTPTPTPPEAKAESPVEVAKREVDRTYQIQQAGQQAVAEIDQTLASLFKEKSDEIARSGGIVNEASLKAEILRENEPLLARRKELAQEYTRANSDYQKARADYNAAQTQSYREEQLGVTKEKMYVQQEQFAEKQALAEQRLATQNIVKKAVYQDGTKVGEEFVNKLTGKPISMYSGTNIPIGSGSPVGESSVNASSQKNAVSGKITYKDFSSVADAPTDENRNTEFPGTAGKTYGAIYEDAIRYIQTGKYQKVGMSTKPSTKAYDNAVKNKAANIAASLGMTEQDLKTLYEANKTAVSQLIKTKSNIAAFENRAKTQIDMILNGYVNPITGKQVPSLNSSVSRSDYPLVNKYFVAGKKLLGDTPAQLLSNSLITFSTEYAKIMAGSTGSVVASSDSARKEAEGLINTALSEGTLSETLGLLQREMETTIEGYDKQIKENMTASSLAPKNLTSNYNSGGSSSVSINSPEWLSSYNYDQDIAFAKEAIIGGADKEQIRQALLKKYKEVNL